MLFSRDLKVEFQPRFPNTKSMKVQVRLFEDIIKERPIILWLKGSYTL